MKKGFFLVAAFFLWGPLFAGIKTKAIDYKDGDTALQGYLAYDDAVKGKRPGILVVHEWWGLNDYARKRAEQLAKLGYVAFALDMYGKGVLTKDFKEAAKLSGIYKADRPMMRQRAKAGMEVLEKQPQTDVKKLAVMGYC